jgi:hypothetical protein
MCVARRTSIVAFNMFLFVMQTASWSNKEVQWKITEAELRLEVTKLKKVHSKSLL